MKADIQQQLQQLSQSAKARRQAEEAAAEAGRMQQRAAQRDEVAFAAAVGKVTPLKNRNQYQHPRDTRPIKPRRQTEAALAAEDYFYVGAGADDTVPANFSKNGQGEHDIRRLQARHWPVVGYVDLHGCRQEEAQQLLNEFVDYVQQRGVCGEVVHGSGLGSKDFAPVLKTTVRRWLMAHPEVLAYAEPHKNNDGAVLILLRRRPRVPHTE